MREKNKSKREPNLKEYINGYGQWFYLRAKIGWAAWLGRQSAGLSKAKLKAILFLILLTWVGYCSYLIVRGFSDWEGAAVYLAPIETIIPANKGSGNAHAIVSKAEYKRIGKFRDYMDSLREGDIAGKKLHDSLLTARPGLMDSIKQIENYYESNLKR